MSRSIASGFTCTISGMPLCFAMNSRNRYISWNFQRVSMCISGKGGGAGKNALRARCTMTELSLPTEYSMTGFSLSATASRRMWMLSASRRSRWLRPAPLARGSGRAGGTSSTGCRYRRSIVTSSMAPHARASVVSEPDGNTLIGFAACACSMRSADSMCVACGASVASGTQKLAPRASLADRHAWPVGSVCSCANSTRRRLLRASSSSQSRISLFGTRPEASRSDSASTGSGTTCNSRRRRSAVRLVSQCPEACRWSNAESVSQALGASSPSRSLMGLSGMCRKMQSAICNVSQICF